MGMWKNEIFKSDRFQYTIFQLKEIVQFANIRLIMVIIREASDLST